MSKSIIQEIVDAMHLAFAPKAAPKQDEELKEPRKLHLENLKNPDEFFDFMKPYIGKELIGVSVGKCVISGKEVEKEALAHAHTGKGYLGAGYICCQSEKDFKKYSTMAHELAHLTAQRGHTLNWAREYTKFVKDTKYERWLTVPWLKNKYKFKTRKKQKTT